MVTTVFLVWITWLKQLVVATTHVTTNMMVVTTQACMLKQAMENVYYIEEQYCINYYIIAIIIHISSYA